MTSEKNNDADETPSKAIRRAAGSEQDGDYGDFTRLDSDSSDDQFWEHLGWDDAFDGLAPGVRAYVEYSDDPDRRLVVTGICLRGDVEHPLTAEILRRFPIGRFEVLANTERAQGARRLEPQLPSLRRPTGSNSDEFYELVAAHYSVHAAISRKPAAEMAAGADVPVTTVHRWIREARLRGILPKGSRGKTG